MSVNITIKNSGKPYPFELSLSDTFGSFKQQIYQKTHIPIERQKILMKGNFNDETLISDLNLRPGQTIMLLGSAELNLVVPPSKPLYNDDDIKEEQVINYPIGLANFGNTCYLNATIQVLFNIQIVKNMILNSDKIGEMGTHENLLSQLRSTFKELEARKHECCEPKKLVTSLRSLFSQFGEREHNGIFKQQDAEELYTQLLLSLKNTLGDDFTSNFGISFKTQIKNLEDPNEVGEKFEEDMKLRCHITGQTNFMKNGITESLSEIVEKHSTNLGKNCEFEISKKITKLPKILTVQFVRFFWKKSTFKKSKILRKVQFPFQLDLSDLLDDEYRESKIKIRDELRLLEKEFQVETHDFKKQKKSKKDEEIFLSKHYEEFLAKYQSKFPDNLAKGENASSLYTLCGVITHKGAAADSGHYQAFTKDKYDDNKWWKFDDDNVSIIDKERIETLAGGGESDSALILIYKGFGLE